MKEPKFRAWDKIHEKYREPMVYDILNDKIVVRLPIETLKKGEFLLEQYAGLKDKNSKEIYEGDILRFKSGPKSVVKFCEIKDSDCTYFYLGWASVQDGCEPMSLCEEAGFCEVIGNIHENPELLGEEEE